MAPNEHETRSYRYASMENGWCSSRRFFCLLVRFISFHSRSLPASFTPADITVFVLHPFVCGEGKEKNTAFARPATRPPLSSSPRITVGRERPAQSDNYSIKGAANKAAPRKCPANAQQSKWERKRKRNATVLYA